MPSRLVLDGRLDCLHAVRTGLLQQRGGKLWLLDLCRWLLCAAHRSHVVYSLHTWDVLAVARDVDLGLRPVSNRNMEQHLGGELGGAMFALRTWQLQRNARGDIVR